MSVGAEAPLGRGVIPCALQRETLPRRHGTACLVRLLPWRYP